MRALGRPLRVVLVGEDVALQVRDVHHAGTAVAPHPRRREDLVRDEGGPDGLSVLYDRTSQHRGCRETGVAAVCLSVCLSLSLSAFLPF